MKPPSTLFRMAAVMSSMLLVGGFVSYRVGAFPELKGTRQPVAEAAPGTTSEQGRLLFMAGSKSDVGLIDYMGGSKAFVPAVPSKFIIHPTVEVPPEPEVPSLP